MIIRAYRPEDESTIRAIRDRHHKDLALPPRDNRIIEGVVTDERGIAAYGVVATFAEAILVMDLDRSLREKHWIVHNLMDGAIMGTRVRDVGELHVTTTELKWAKVLERQYGFKPVDGQALVREA